VQNVAVDDNATFIAFKDAGAFAAMRALAVKELAVRQLAEAMDNAHPCSGIAL
jgi:hypothetical protein